MISDNCIFLYSLVVKLLLDRRPNPNWNGLLYTKWWIDCVFKPTIHWHFCFVIKTCIYTCFPVWPLTLSLTLFPLPPSVPSYLPSSFLYHLTNSSSSFSSPVSFALSCVSLHAWLAAVILVLPSMITGHHRQIFDNTTLYRPSILSFVITDSSI